MNLKILIIFLIAVKVINCNETLRIRFSNEKERNLVNKFRRNRSINYEKLDSNSVQTTINHTKTGLELKNFLLDNKIAFIEVRKRSSKGRSSTLGYENRHMEYKDILKMLIKWKNLKEKEYENKIEIYEIGRTAKNRPIVVAKITDQVHVSNNTKKAIFIESGIHAREWGAVDTALYIMSDLIFEPYYKDVLKKWVFYFLIVANPDGYIYTFTTNRSWRKNLNRNKGSSCHGVDLNRNFDIDFGLVNSQFCNENYKGTKAFSEEESKAERDYIVELIESGHKIDLFLAFHTYGQQITYPYGYSKKKIPNWRESHEVLKKVTKNIELYNKAIYTYGQTYHVIYPASGGSDDWIMFKNYTRFTYVMELRDKGDHFGFFLPENMIEETALDGVIALNTILDHLSPGIVSIKKPGK